MPGKKEIEKKEESCGETGRLQKHIKKEGACELKQKHLPLRPFKMRSLEVENGKDTRQGRKGSQADEKNKSY